MSRIPRFGCLGSGKAVQETAEAQGSVQNHNPPCRSGVACAEWGCWDTWCRPWERSKAACDCRSHCFKMRYLTLCWMSCLLDRNKLSLQLVLPCFCATPLWVSHFCTSFITYVLACWCFTASAEENVQLFTATQASSSACQKHLELWTGLRYRFIFNAVSSGFFLFPEWSLCKKNPNLLSKLVFDLLLQKVFKGTQFQFKRATQASNYYF